MRKEERSEIIQDALEFLDDEMIEDVEKLRGCVSKEEAECCSNMENDNILIRKADKWKMERKTIWRRGIVLAASICVLFVGSWIYEIYLQPADSAEQISEVNQENIFEHEVDENKTDFRQENSIEDSISDDIDRPESAAEEALKEELQGTVHADNLTYGVHIPRMEVSLKRNDGIEGDMLGFFILNGRSYIQYEFQTDYVEKDADFVGDYVGHITGLIDEWTNADGYVDGAGTYTGNVYEVKGVSPEFMLCMVWENGWVETFINHNDITLYKGADLVDNWLDLRGNYDAIAFETIIDNQFAYESLELSEEELEVFDQFLDAFAEADYVYVEEIVEHPFGGDWDTADMMDFYYVKENGVRLRFRTMGDGYVMFPWIDACVKIDQNAYDAIVEILLKHAQ